MLDQKIIECFTWITNVASQGYLHTENSDASVRADMKQGFELFYEELKEHINFETLTADDMRDLRFGKWSKDSELRLIPLYLVPLIPDDMEVYHPDGTNSLAKEAKKDLDLRYGKVAWGLYPKPEKKEVQ